MAGQVSADGHSSIARRTTLYYDTATGFTKSEDQVTVEEPLEIRICRKEGDECRVISVTMRTPGMDRELAVGFLFTEGIIHASSDVISASHSLRNEKSRNNVMEVVVPDQVYQSNLEYRRNFSMNSSCGVCGKSSINEVFVRGSSIVRSDITAAPSLILTLPSRLREVQKVFSKTGGIHAAGIFSGAGELQAIAEDVGRHNAVDKAIGCLLLRGMIPATGSIMQISGRAGFEMVQKGIMGGIPIISSVSAPSSLAIETAESFNVTLVCFVRGGRFNVYTHEKRITVDRGS